MQAFALAQTITDKEQRVRVLAIIAEKLAEMGNITPAQAFAQPVAVKEWQVRVLAIVASGIEAAWSTYSCVIDQAVTLALKPWWFTHAKEQVEELVHIAEVQARVGDCTAAQKSYSQSVTAAQAIPESTYELKNRHHVLAEIAETQAKTGDIAQAPRERCPRAVHTLAPLAHNPTGSTTDDSKEQPDSSTCCQQVFVENCCRAVVEPPGA